MGRAASLETLTRLGFAARGLLYIVIGYVTLRTGHAADNAEALSFLQGGVGNVLLYVMAMGFAAYGLWRLLEAWFDSEGHGTQARGIAVRIGGAISGLVHLALCFSAIRLARRAGASSGEQSATDGASTALGLPGGELLLTLAAVAITVTGLYQLVKAVKADFLKHLHPDAAHKEWALWLGRLGYAARGIVFVAIGLFLWKAAQSADASRAVGMEQAIEAFPSALRMVIAGGLVFFGLYSLVEAAYRRINDPHVLARLRAG